MYCQFSSGKRRADGKWGKPGGEERKERVREESLGDLRGEDERGASGACGGGTGW